MDIARLFDCPLCTGIPEREREQFIEGFDYSVKSYMKGEVVFRQGDVCRFLYILLEGEVEAEMTDDSGAMLRIEAIRAPRALAPAFLFRFSDLRIAISRQIDEVRLAVHAEIVDVDGLARLLTDARKIFALQHAGFADV